VPFTEIDLQILEFEPAFEQVNLCGFSGTIQAFHCDQAARKPKFGKCLHQRTKAKTSGPQNQAGSLLHSRFNSIANGWLGSAKDLDAAEERNPCNILFPFARHPIKVKREAVHVESSDLWITQCRNARTLYAQPADLPTRRGRTRTPRYFGIPSFSAG